MVTLFEVYMYGNWVLLGLDSVTAVAVLIRGTRSVHRIEMHASQTSYQSS